MNEQIIQKIRDRKPKMAICYDFDKTLSPDDMQAFTLIPSFGMKNAEFWAESDKLAKDNLMDNNLAWMYQLIQYSRVKRLPIRKEYFHQIGATVALYKGVDTWFRRMNQYAERKGIGLEHYIISSGLKEIIEGSAIAPFIKRIYASSYLYSADGVAEWPAQAINYTNKTQFIFRIAKGVFEEYDERVNDSMSEDQLYMPYENIVYIGDSATDIPCMRLVKSKGGYSIGVFDPTKNERKKVYRLFSDKRINFYAPADYSARSEISCYMKQIIDEVVAREHIKVEQRILRVNADTFKVYSIMNRLIDSMANSTTAKEIKKLRLELEEIKSSIDGNID